MKRTGKVGILICAASLVALAAGCAQDVRLRPGLTPISGGSRSPLRVALLIDSSIPTHVDSAKPTSVQFATAMSTYNFRVGEALAPLIEKAAEEAFRKVSKVSALPSPEATQQMEVDGTLQVKLIGTNLALDAQEGLFTQTMRTNYEVTLQGVFFDRTGRQLFSTNARASAFSSQDRGLMSQGGHEFSGAVEKAVREVAGNVIQQVATSSEVIRYADGVARPVIR